MPLETILDGRIRKQVVKGMKESMHIYLYFVREIPEVEDNF